MSSSSSSSFKCLLSVEIDVERISASDSLGAKQYPKLFDKPKIKAYVILEPSDIFSLLNTPLGIILKYGPVFILI
jgi:hypothetical protein